MMFIIKKQKRPYRDLELFGIFRTCGRVLDVLELLLLKRDTWSIYSIYDRHQLLSPYGVQSKTVVVSSDSEGGSDEFIRIELT